MSAPDSSSRRLQSSHVLDRVVILGAGHAAAQAVETLRHRGLKVAIVLVGDEPCVPYQRPPLSKTYLAGRLERDRLAIRSGQYHTEHAVEMRLSRRALEIDRQSQRVRLDDGSSLAYDALLIATGSRPRALPIPGADLEGVHYLRTIADVDRPASRRNFSAFSEAASHSVSNP